MSKTIKSQMDEYWNNFDSQSFITNDPISIVHKMNNTPNRTIADIEICAMWTAMIAWGKREQIIKTTNDLMNMCDWKPAEFVKLWEFSEIPDDKPIYRTLKGVQFKQVCHNLRLFYNKYDSIQSVLNDCQYNTSIDFLMMSLCDWFEPARLGSPQRNSACKRINMLLRWMIRKDDIDLGLWATQNIHPSQLYAIMDIHVAKQATKMGLISYPKDSWKAVLELTDVYRSWDINDPLKYDFVLLMNDLK